MTGNNTFSIYADHENLSGMFEAYDRYGFLAEGDTLAECRAAAWAAMDTRDERMAALVLELEAS